MKKILLYIDVMTRGGAQRVMANISDFLCKSGYKVLLLTDQPPKNPEIEYPINRNIRRIYLENGKGNRIRRQVMRAVRLRRVLKREKPDIALSFLRGPNLRLLLCGLGLGAKTVVSVRSDPRMEYRGILLKGIAKFLFSCADGVVFQTEEAALFFQKSVRTKAAIIPNPVKDTYYQVCRADWNSQDIIAVGRLTEEKRPLLLLSAFARIANCFPQARLILYGKGDLQEQLEQEAAALKLGHRVLLPGEVEDVPQRLSQAGIYVLCSDWEGMPNALMEAMATGLPVIATDCPCGGPRFLIRDQTQGILTKCGDEAGLAAALKTLLSDPELRRSMGEAARERAKAFHEDIVMNHWIAYLEKTSGEINAAQY